METEGQDCAAGEAAALPAKKIDKYKDTVEKYQVGS